MFVDSAFHMASRKSSVGRKTLGSNKGSYNAPFEEHRFRNHRHAGFYDDFERRNMVHAWTIELEDPGDYLDIVQEINYRGLSVLDITPKHINIDIIQEINSM